MFQTTSRQVDSKCQCWNSCQLPQQASYNHVNFYLFLELSHIYLAAQTDYQNLRGLDLCEKIRLKLHFKSEHVIGRRITMNFFFMHFMPFRYMCVNLWIKCFQRFSHAFFCHTYEIEESHVSVMHLFRKQWPLKAVQEVFQTLSFHWSQKTCFLMWKQN